jgi:hypothetical protein
MCDTLDGYDPESKDQTWDGLKRPLPKGLEPRNPVRSDAANATSIHPRLDPSTSASTPALRISIDEDFR